MACNRWGIGLNYVMAPSKWLSTSAVFRAKIWAWILHSAEIGLRSIVNVLKSWKTYIIFSRRHHRLPNNIPGKGEVGECPNQKSESKPLYQLLTMTMKFLLKLYWEKQLGRTHFKILLALTNSLFYLFSGLLGIWPGKQEIFFNWILQVSVT